MKCFYIVNVDRNGEKEFWTKKQCLTKDFSKAMTTFSKTRIQNEFEVAQGFYSTKNLVIEEKV